MSMDPGTMQALLAQRLGQSSSPTYGGGGAGPQMQARQNPMTAGSDIAQKLLLMRALQQNPRGAPPLQPAQPVTPPQPNMLGGVNGVPQTMNAQPVPGGGINA